MVNEELLVGKRVMVYYNLHKHTFSVKHKNKVVLHADYIKLSDVEFRVRKTGNKRVKEEKQKNVHAFVIGNIVKFINYPSNLLPEEPNNNIVTYNPYKNFSFVNKLTNTPVYLANEVDMINLKNKLFILK